MSSSPPSFPPGCGFYPSEQQILTYYLPLKNDSLKSSPTSAGDHPSRGSCVIKELNLYNYDPFSLPDSARFEFGYGGRKRHWYCYVKKICGLGGKLRRKARSGYWKRKGRVRNVMGGGEDGAGKEILGRRSCFVFYSEGKCSGDQSSRGVSTDWIMYEYAPSVQLKASFVLCRVFARPRVQHKVIEHGLSSLADETAANVRHVGIQHDGSVTSGIDKVEGDKIKCVDRRNILDGSCDGLVGESLAYSPGVLLNDLVTSPQLGGSWIFPNSSPMQNLKCLLEGDFIEMDDLI